MDSPAALDVTPEAHGLARDPRAWQPEPLLPDFTAADGEQPTPAELAIRRGDAAVERRRAQNGGRLGGMLICNDTGSYLVTDDDTSNEEAFDRAVPGSVEAMEIVERIRAADARHTQERAATMTPSRRPNCAVAKVYARARSGLRGGRGRGSGGRRRTSTPTSSRGKPRRSSAGDDDGPGEHLAAHAVGSARLLRWIGGAR